MLLKELSWMTQPSRVLEIGMFVGYGSTAILEGARAAQVVSLEIDPYLKGWLASCLEPFPKVANRHEVVVGPALESLPKLEGQFDLVFVDANKAEYRRYVELILEHGLLSQRGTIVAEMCSTTATHMSTSTSTHSLHAVTSATRSETSTSGSAATLSWSKWSCRSETVSPS